jgi:hypothetical protein
VQEEEEGQGAGGLQAAREASAGLMQCGALRFAIATVTAGVLVWLAAPTVAEAASPCEGNPYLQVRYVGPCSVTLPSNQLEFTSTSNQVTYMSVAGAPNWYGEAEVDHVTGPDSEGKYHIFFLVRYAPVGTMGLYIYTAEGQQTAFIDVLGNQGPPFSDFKPVTLTAQRLAGGGCRLQTSVSFFAAQDFRYRIGLKLAGDHPIFKRRSKLKRVTAAAQSIEVRSTTGWFQHHTLTRSIVIKKRQVRALSTGHFTLRAFQALWPAAVSDLPELHGTPTKQPFYSAGKRVANFTGARCQSTTPAEL